METIEKAVEILNDLIEINNDRVAGFEHALKDLGEGDADLKTLFEGFSNESREYISELTLAASRLGGDADVSHSVSGTLHRTWLDVKATFTGHDRASVLEECERGEDAIKHAYRDALSGENGLPAELAQLLSTQQQGIVAAHDQIKMLRNMQA